MTASQDDLPPRPVRAYIEPAGCIGCAKCLPACPVDAILGAHRYLHAVLPDACTGCGLCLPPCPTNCITLVPAALDFAWPETPADDATAARAFLSTQVAMELDRVARKARRTASVPNAGGEQYVSPPADQAAMQMALEAARARARKDKSPPGAGSPM